MGTSQPSYLIQTVTTEAARLRDFLTGLDANTWASDSTCYGWTNEDVVTHLAGSASGWASTITRAIDGDYGPPEKGNLSWHLENGAPTPQGMQPGRPGNHRV
jgi:hypothetical protein